MKKKIKLGSVTTKTGNAYTYDKETREIKSRMDKFGNMYNGKGEFVGHIDGGNIKRTF